MDDWKKTMQNLLLEINSYITIHEESFSKWNMADENKLDIGDCAHELLGLARILLTQLMMNRNASLKPEDKDARIKLQQYEFLFEKLNGLIQVFKENFENRILMMKKYTDSLVEVREYNETFLSSVTLKYNAMKNEKEEMERKLINSEKLYRSVLKELSNITDMVKDLRLSVINSQACNGDYALPTNEKNYMDSATGQEPDLKITSSESWGYDLKNIKANSFVEVKSLPSDNATVIEA